MSDGNDTEITDGLRQWALWSFKCMDVDLESYLSPSAVDQCIRAWDFYTNKGCDFGSAASLVLRDLQAAADALPPSDV